MYYKKKSFFNKYVIMGITAVVLIAVISLGSINPYVSNI